MFKTVDGKTGFQPIIRPDNFYLYRNVTVKDILYIVDMQCIQNRLFSVLYIQSVEIARIPIILKNHSKTCPWSRAIQCNGVPDGDRFAEMDF